MKTENNFAKVDQTQYSELFSHGSSTHSSSQAVIRASQVKSLAQVVTKFGNETQPYN